MIAGKGHETTQTSGDASLPFDDRVVAREELLGRSGLAGDRLLIAAGVAPGRRRSSARTLLIGWLGRTASASRSSEDGPEGHMIKAGTPTMGGIAIVGAACRRLRRRPPAQRRRLHPHRPARHARMIGAGLVGFLDDWIKVPQRAQPRPQQARQDDRPARRGRRRSPCATVRLHQRARRRSPSPGSTTPGIELGNVGWASARCS